MGGHVLSTSVYCLHSPERAGWNRERKTDPKYEVDISYWERKRTLSGTIAALSDSVQCHVPEGGRESSEASSLNSHMRNIGWWIEKNIDKYIIIKLKILYNEITGGFCLVSIIYLSHYTTVGLSDRAGLVFGSLTYKGSEHFLISLHSEKGSGEVRWRK